MLKRGQIVYVTGKAGTVKAEVVHVEIPDRLPSINGAAELSRVKTIMAEWGIVQVALLMHDHRTPARGKHQVTFGALENSAGEWRDLKGQRLTIVPREEPQCDDDYSGSNGPNQSA
jgi:hypothetical protein